MTDASVTHIAIQTMLITAKLAAPVLVVSLAVGFLISLVQSVTMIQEVTLTFVPKLVAVGVVLIVAGGWMLNQLLSFTRELFALVPSLVSGT